MVTHDHDQKTIVSTHSGKALLWASISALMKRLYGGENLNRLSRDTKCGPGTSTRLKNQETSVGLDTLDKLAAGFNLPQWQLLVPGFDPANPPMLTGGSPQAKDIATMFDEIEDPVRRQQAYALIVQMLSYGMPAKAAPDGQQREHVPIGEPARGR
jgi:hypothetical protein